MKQRNSVISILIFAFAVLIILTSSGYAVTHLRSLAENKYLVEHTLAVLTNLDETLVLLIDAETAQRGYIITGDEKYLEPYNAALSPASGIQQHLQDLREQTKDNLNQQDNLNLLEDLVKTKLAIIQKTIEARKNQGFISAQEIILTDEGKQSMDDIRLLLAEMHSEESQLLQQRSGVAATSMKNIIITLVAGTLVSLLMIGFSFYVVKREIDVRHQAEHAIRQLNDELDLRVKQRTTELSEANKTLQTSETRLRTTLDTMLEGCQIIDYDWRYVYVNNAVVSQGKTTRENLLGHTMMEVYPGIEKSKLFSILERCMEERKYLTMDNQFNFPDGSIGWFKLSIQPSPEGIFILSIDITERKCAEEEVKRQIQRLQALREIDISIIGSTDIYLSIRTVLEQILAQLHVDAANVLMLNSNNHTLKYIAGRGFHTKSIETTELRFGQGIAWHAVYDHIVQHIPDMNNTTENIVRQFLYLDEGFIEYYAIPLSAKGDTLGVLEIFNRQQRNLDSNELDFLNALAGQTAIAIDNSQLFLNLKRANLDLINTYDTTIEGWSHALDLRDKETEGHTRRVTELTLHLGHAAGIHEGELVHIRRGALLHDIGKMGVPDNILLKPAKLTKSEWAIMRTHPSLAYDLLFPITYLRPALDIPYCHHERWDGTGYPRGLKGKQIPLSARLFAVVDVWDGLCSDRPYRKAWKEEKVLKYIKSSVGTHFDPYAVKLFLKLTQRV